MWTRQDERAAEDEDHRKGRHVKPQGWCGLCEGEKRRAATARRERAWEAARQRGAGIEGSPDGHRPFQYPH